MLLTKHGYECHTAESGHAALKFTQTKRPDLIILDVNMPGLSGFRTFEYLKTVPGLQETPMLFLSGSSKTEDMVAGLDLGAEDYLVKPFNTAALLAKMRNVLTRHRAQRPARVDDLGPGAQIADRYQVMSILGRGGMGIVFRVYDEERKRTLALKAMHSNMAQVESFSRFEREIEAMALFEHPNLLRLFDARLSEPFP